MALILLFCHIFFTVRLKFIQRRVFSGIKYSFTSGKNGSGIGTYAAFAAALGTTIGPGNITGVAVAISAGGAGAVFWMWVCGLLAMPTKYAEGYLASKYAEKTADGFVGGTMVLLKKLGMPCLSALWAAFCGAGGLLMGAAVPARSLSSALSLPDWLVGFFLAALVLLAVSCGFRGIAAVSSLLVPVMSCGFLLCCLAVTALNVSRLPAAFFEIMRGALSVKSVGAGAMGAAIKQGMTRGLYSNESGLGSGGILAAESGDGNSVMCALSAMSTVFWDTVVMCAVTGVVFVINGAGRGSDPALTVSSAFAALPCGSLILQASMSLFVLATALGWYYLAARAVSYSFGKRVPYGAAFVASLFFGAVLPPHILWYAADAVNLMMLLPSMYVLFKMNNKILYIMNK